MTGAELDLEDPAELPPRLVEALLTANESSRRRVVGARVVSEVPSGSWTVVVVACVVEAGETGRRHSRIVAVLRTHQGACVAPQRYRADTADGVSEALRAAVRLLEGRD